MVQRETGVNGGDAGTTTAEALRAVADGLTALRAAVGAIDKQLAHSDVIAHETHQKVALMAAVLEKYQPVLDRVTKITGAAGGFWPGRREKPCTDRE
jgi:hypothetical protein